MADWSSVSKFEVEMKFPVTPGQLEAIGEQLQQLKALPSGAMEEVDAYFNHPQRDFAQTDEALRVRQSNQRAYLTYKGPKLDATTKTREEIEVAIGDSGDSAARCRGILEALGFRRVAMVNKFRRRYRLLQDEYDVEVCLDQVYRVGCFVEIEIQADSAAMEAAKAHVMQLAKSLGLSTSERRSYLHLTILANQNPASGPSGETSDNPSG